MISRIGLGVVSECLSKHPYIKTEGGHTSHVAENILVEQVLFYNFKNSVNVGVVNAKLNKAFTKDDFIYWSNYGMLKEQNCILEDAIQKGLKLNYEVLDECVRNFNNDNKYDISIEFIENFESLVQLANIKLIESKLLALFEKNIDREYGSGEINILQSITTATDFIYSMHQTNLLHYTKIMKELSVEDFFTKTEGRLITKTTNLTKEEALTKYLALPMMIFDEIIEFALMSNCEEKYINELQEQLSNFVENLVDMNDQVAKTFKESFENAIQDNQVYMPNNERRHDDYSIN